MNRKNNLLSIGEISKLTGAGIKALRYYDRINILKPAYIDHDSGYRYYSFNQVNLIYLIMFCVELGIPLKELPDFIKDKDIVNYRAFLAHGKEAAQKKMKALNKGLKVINFFEQKVAIQKEYPLETIYTRQFPEKYFQLIPYDGTFENLDHVKVARLFIDASYQEDEDGWLMEYGLLCENSPSGVQRYVFVEISHTGSGVNYKTIPAGVYHCRQSDTTQIEQAGTIFGDYLEGGAGKSSYIAIETESFSGKFNINKPLNNELRVITL